MYSSSQVAPFFFVASWNHPRSLGISSVVDSLCSRATELVVAIFFSCLPLRQSLSLLTKPGYFLTTLFPIFHVLAKIGKVSELFLGFPCAPTPLSLPCHVTALASHRFPSRSGKHTLPPATPFPPATPLCRTVAAVDSPPSPLPLFKKKKIHES